MDLTAFNNATGINARTVSLNDVFITKTSTGVEINVYVDGDSESVSQLANTLSDPQHLNPLNAELRESTINGASSLTVEGITLFRSTSPTKTPSLSPFH